MSSKAMAHWGRRVSGGLGTVLLWAVLGCADDSTGPVRVASVVISPDEIVVFGTTSTQLQATALSDQGTALVGRAITWSSSDTAVATVDGQGLVTARSAGEVTIRARSEGRVGSAIVRVLVLWPASIDRIELTPGDHEFWTAGASVQFTAIARAADGSALAGRSITWSSDNTSVASVDAAGVVTARGSGTALITAAAEGRQAQAQVRVLLVTGEGFDLVFVNRAGHLLIESAGGQRRRLALPDGMVAYLPAASPDGNTIAFAAYTEPDRNADIWLIERDGSDLRRLTQHDGTDDMPSWSPDGERIAFRSERSGTSNLFTMKKDGSNVVQMTHDPLPGVIIERFPAYSPDGRTLAFTSNEEGVTQVWLMDLATGARRRLTSGAASESQLSWSPDGAYMAVRRVDEVNDAIAVVTVATGAVRRLPAPVGVGGAISSPAWSPDGSLIAFTFEDVYVYSQIYTIRPDGSGLTAVAGDEANGGILHPGWVRR